MFLKYYKCRKENGYLQRQTVTTVYLGKMTKRTLRTTTTSSSSSSSSSTASNNIRGLRMCLIVTAAFYENRTAIMRYSQIQFKPPHNIICFVVTVKSPVVNICTTSLPQCVCGLYAVYECLNKHRSVLPTQH
jgi:hypothetical protein